MTDSNEYEVADSWSREFGQSLKRLIEALLRSESITVNQVTYRVKNRESANSKVRDNPENIRRYVTLPTC